MARIYTHLADTDRVILELNDLVPKEKQNGKFTSVTCPRCGTVNPFGSKDCSKCFLSLESQEAKEEVTLRQKIKAMDTYGAESEWSDPLSVTMPRTRAITSPFLNFLQQHPNLFPILQILLQRLGLQ